MHAALTFGLLFVFLGKKLMILGYLEAHIHLVPRLPAGNVQQCFPLYYRQGIYFFKKLTMCITCSTFGRSFQVRHPPARGTLPKNTSAVYFYLSWATIFSYPPCFQEAMCTSRLFPSKCQRLLGYGPCTGRRESPAGALAPSCAFLV